jgi:nucleotide-binding universal stress UspA family protein
MAKKSLLLGLDGSAQSKYAAEIAWSLAKTGNMKITAQHVIDSLAAWDFLCFDIAGFIGSGPYFTAHEAMRNSLHSIGETLIDVYKSMAQPHKIDTECFLDEGTTIREISNRAKEHDLVIIGHRPTGMQSEDEDQRILPRRSTAETLTYYSPKPLLVVQDRIKPWTNMRLLLSTAQVPSQLLNSFVDFASSVSITPEVRYLVTSDPDANISDDKASTDALKLSKDLTKLVPGLAKSKIDAKAIGNINHYMRDDAEIDPDTLPVVPVFNIAGIRKTCLGVTPDTLVRYLSHPAILFWIEEVPVKASKLEKTSAKT